MSQKSKSNRDTLDAWVIFEHLYGAQRKDLIDYLIHQLYYLSDDDIDFFIPQLCTLLICRDEQLSKQLECYILHKCMNSIDFAIKCFWNLHAIQFYSKIDAQRDRCDEMRQNLEMIVVNGQLPRNLLMQIPKDIQKEIINQQQSQPNHLNHQQKEQKSQQNGHSHSNGNNSHNNQPHPPSLSSALPQPKKPTNLKAVDPLLNGATEYLKKQRRCTYFNAELDFAHFLEGVSSALEQCDREDRPRLLEDNIRYANKCLPRGLYIPIAQHASDAHKSLLRIVPNESKCLDSKQKVPFLLFCETEQHGYPTSSSAICEELTESETALLSSSGLYVLIDEHRKRKHKDKDKDIEGKPAGKKKKNNNPKRLKPTKRKPSRPFNKSKHKNNKPLPAPAAVPVANAKPARDITPPQEVHSLSQTPLELDPVEYSISSVEDDDEMKSSDSNERTVTEPSQSVTMTNPAMQKVNISSIPVPQPRPIDKVAEEAMKRHLKALEPFEPSNHKALKKEKCGDNARVQLMRASDKHTKHYNSSSQLHAVAAPSRKSKFGRSRTPEPDKNRKMHQRNNLNHCKSDGNLSPDARTNNAAHRQPPVGANANSKGGAAQSIKYSGKSQKAAVVIYRHPNYENSQHSKLQYLRGKSMQWKDPFGEPWNERHRRYKQESPFKANQKWSMQSVIFKSGEDMRQEQMAMQFIKLFAKIFSAAKLPLQLRPYSVIVTSPASGFVETVPNSVSISKLKHNIRNFVSLRKFFEQFYGPIGSPGFQLAQKNFVESMAGYSLVSYFLQIKDRHNGNILLTSDGRIVHIDFDFLFSNSPGGNIGFESAPFKLTEEFIQVMGGEENSEMFDYFKILLIRGFLEARKHFRKFVLISQIMLQGAPMPCFLAGESVINQLQHRFAIKLKNEKCVEHVYNLIEESACNWRSVQYDKFQRITNNIL